MNPTVTAPPPAPDLPDLRHSLLERSPVPMAELEGVGHVLRYVNPAFCRLVGKSKEALLGTPFADTVPAGDGCLALVERVYRTGEAETHTEAAHPEPHPAYWSYALWPVLDAEQHPVGVMVQVTETTPFHQQTLAMNEALLRSSVHQHELTEAAENRNEHLQAELTERKRAEETRLRLAAIVESSDDAIISKSLDGIISSWNAAAERIFGYRAEEMIGQPILRLLPEDRQDEERLILERLRQGEGMNHFETVRRTKDGRLLDVSVTISPLRSERGTIIGASKIARDITVQKQQAGELVQRATELERLNAELQQFSYVASHDLQEPLRTITSYLQLLARRYQGNLDPEADEYIGFAVDGAQRMQTLITALLAYTRAGANAQAFTAVDCEAVLAHTLSDLQIARQDTAADITHDPLPTVHGDAAQLGLVFQNLVGNALKFRGVAPLRVHLSAQREGPHWRFAVRDNGIGLDPRHAGRIFQIFQRLHTSREYPGTGIGLAICKKIVERHGGQIWVESAPGQGATFFFTLPATEAGRAAPRHSPEGQV
jgi:PAS domain S-box-containing protein